MSAGWPGLLDAEVRNPSIVDAALRLSDAAEEGRWEVMFEMLESKEADNSSKWRFGGTSWFAPLPLPLPLHARVDRGGDYEHRTTDRRVPRTPQLSPEQWCNAVAP